MSDPKRVSRKGFFGEFFGAMKKGIANQVDRKLAKVLEAPIRPPGALDEIEFLSACTRCALCVDACPYFAIKRMSLHSGVSANTPFIDTAAQACQLCEDFPCIQACGDGALLPVNSPREVTMGKALINPEACQTWDDKVCTHCYDACPFPEQAIEIGADFHPRILDACVGCGLCEKACPVTPVGVAALSPVNYRSVKMEDEMYFGLVEKEPED